MNNETASTGMQKTEATRRGHVEYRKNAKREAERKGARKKENRRDEDARAYGAIPIRKKNLDLSAKKENCPAGNKNPTRPQSRRGSVGG